MDIDLDVDLDIMQQFAAAANINQQRIDLVVPRLTSDSLTEHRPDAIPGPVAADVMANQFWQHTVRTTLLRWRRQTSWWSLLTYLWLQRGRTFVYQLVTSSSLSHRHKVTASHCDISGAWAMPSFPTGTFSTRLVILLLCRHLPMFRWRTLTSSE